MTAGAFSWLGDIVSLIGDLTDKLNEWAGHWWFLLVVLVIAFLDSIIPVVPSETTVIIAGVAVSTEQATYPLVLVIAAGALGAFLGDNTAYAIGRHFAPRFEARAMRRPIFAARLTWADRQITERGGLLLITARFIPGGRTVLTLASGITRQRRLWFVKWVAVAAVIWATYAATLAYLVGKPFEDNQKLAFWIAFGTAMGINVLIEVVRHQRKRRAGARAATTPLE